MKNHSRVAIIILNWNGLDLLREYLPNIIQHSKGAEIIIADNGSTDDSLSFLNDNYPEIRIIDNKENLGFAGGYNKALSQVESEFYIVLNSDIKVGPNWISPIIELMDSNSEIAIAQPKILSLLEPNKFEYAGASGGFIDYLGYPFCRGRLFETLEEDLSQYDDPRECFWATGAAMFIRSKVFHKLGGFDAEFFAHQEEIDLCWRAHNRGYKVYVCPSSKVYHLGGGTLNKTSPLKTYLNFRNNHYLLYKNHPVKTYKKIYRKRLILDIIASFTFLLKGNYKEFKAVYSALRDFRKNRDKLFKERNTQNIEAPNIYPKSLLFDYHFLRNKTFDKLRSSKASTRPS